MQPLHRCFVGTFGETAGSGCGEPLHAHMGNQIKLAGKMDVSKCQVLAVALLVDEEKEKIHKKQRFGLEFLK